MRSVDYKGVLANILGASPTEDSAATAVGTHIINRPHALACLARLGPAMLEIIRNHVYLAVDDGRPARILCNRV